MLARILARDGTQLSATHPTAPSPTPPPGSARRSRPLPRRAARRRRRPPRRRPASRALDRTADAVVTRAHPPRRLPRAARPPRRCSPSTATTRPDVLADAAADRATSARRPRPRRRPGLATTTHPGRTANPPTCRGAAAVAARHPRRHSPTDPDWGRLPAPTAPTSSPPSPAPGRRPHPRLDARPPHPAWATALLDHRDPDLRLADLAVWRAAPASIPATDPTAPAHRNQLAADARTPTRPDQRVHPGSWETHDAGDHPLARSRTASTRASPPTPTGPPSPTGSPPPTAPASTSPPWPRRRSPPLAAARRAPRRRTVVAPAAAPVPRRHGRHRHSATDTLRPDWTAQLLAVSSASRPPHGSSPTRPGPPWSPPSPTPPTTAGNPTRLLSTATTSSPPANPTTSRYLPDDELATALAGGSACSPTSAHVDSPDDPNQSAGRRQETRTIGRSGRPRPLTEPDIDGAWLTSAAHHRQRRRADANQPASRRSTTRRRDSRRSQPTRHALEPPLTPSDRILRRARMLELNSQALAYFTAHYADSWAAGYLADRLGPTSLTTRASPPVTPRPAGPPSPSTCTVMAPPTPRSLAAGLGTRARTGRLIDRFRDRLILPIPPPTPTAGDPRVHRPPQPHQHRPGRQRRTEVPQHPRDHLVHKGNELYGLAEARDRSPPAPPPSSSKAPWTPSPSPIAGNGDYVGVAPLGHRVHRHASRPATPLPRPRPAAESSWRPTTTAPASTPPNARSGTSPPAAEPPPTWPCPPGTTPPSYSARPAPSSSAPPSDPQLRSRPS